LAPGECKWQNIVEIPI